MSYIYSQALVAAFSEANCSATDAFAQLSESHTHKPFLWHDKTMEPSRHSRFGMTFAPLTENLGAELLMWWRADFLAKTYQSPETGPDWTAKGQGYGEKWRGLLAKYDPATHSLKTAQLSLLEDSMSSSPTLPRWGLMLDGELYPQPIPALITEENESGYWPTPTTQDNVQIRGVGAAAKAKNRGTTLSGAVKMWPTETATAYKGWSPNHNRASSDDRLDYSVEREIFQHGQQTPPKRLNPDWVEWLMGWPIGHTELKPLATAKYQEWQQQHSPFFRNEADAA